MRCLYISLHHMGLPQTNMRINYSAIVIPFIITQLKQLSTIIYNIEEKNLKGDQIITIFQDSDGDEWILTNKGISIIGKKKDVYKRQALCSWQDVPFYRN